MNVNLYVYVRKKCTLTSKRTLEHGIENTILQLSAGIMKCEKFHFANHFCLLKKFWKCERFLCLASFSSFLSTSSVQAVEERFPPDVSSKNVVMVRKGRFYRHFSEHGSSPCKTVSSRGAGETPKRGPEKYLIGSNWLIEKHPS